MKTKIILAGGSGFRGNVLANYFAAQGIEVVLLTRNPKQRADMILELSTMIRAPRERVFDLARSLGSHRDINPTWLWVGNCCRAATRLLSPRRLTTGN